MNQYIVVGIILVVLVALLATNKKLIETLKNIYKIEELRSRILFTLGLLVIYRLGSFVTLPGINHAALEAQMAQAMSGDNGLMGLLNVFSGGAFSQASIFALGVMPYITASIIIQLLGIMVPYFRKMQREGESGRRKMNQWTRFLTIGVLMLQAPAYLKTMVMRGDVIAMGESTFIYTSTFITARSITNSRVRLPLALFYPFLDLISGVLFLVASCIN